MLKPELQKRALEAKVSFIELLFRDFKWMEQNWSTVSDICPHFDNTTFISIVDNITYFTPVDVLNCFLLVLHHRHLEDGTFTMVSKNLLKKIQSTYNPYNVVLPELFSALCHVPAFNTSCYTYLVPHSIRYLNTLCLFLPLITNSKLFYPPQLILHISLSTD